MTLVWTPEQIRSHYRVNRNLTILADLNGCEPKHIKEVVSDLIIPTTSGRKRKYVNTRTEIHTKALAKRTLWRKYYDEGLNDSEIAQKAEANRGQVTAWRNSERLPTNRRVASPFGIGYIPMAKSGNRKTPAIVERENRQRELYNQGKSDGEIGMVLGICSQSVYVWRRANKLPANNKNNEQKKKILKTNVEGI